MLFLALFWRLFYRTSFRQRDSSYAGLVRQGKFSHHLQRRVLAAMLPYHLAGYRQSTLVLTKRDGERSDTSEPSNINRIFIKRCQCQPIRSRENQRQSFRPPPCVRPTPYEAIYPFAGKRTPATDCALYSQYNPQPAILYIRGENRCIDKAEQFLTVGISRLASTFRCTGELRLASRTRHADATQITMWGSERADGPFCLTGTGIEGFLRRTATLA